MEMSSASKKTVPHNEGIREIPRQERLEAFAETGDPSYLTPNIAREIRIGPGIMRDVPNATLEDVEYAARCEEEDDALLLEKDDLSLRAYGADSESLDSLDIQARIQKLFDVASLRQNSVSAHNIEDTKQTALERLGNLLAANDEGVFRLFDAVRYDSPQSLRDLDIIELLYETIHARFVSLSHTGSLSGKEVRQGEQSARILNEFVHAARGVLQSGEVLADTNYLFGERLKVFAQDIGFPEVAAENPDRYMPFEITQGVYAIFSDDGDRVYIADTETSDHIAQTIPHIPQPERHEEGQYFARYNVTNIPEELYGLREEVLDNGTPIDQIVADMGITDPNLIHDYVTMLRSRTRSVVEEDFHVDFLKLSIREQIYAVQFLKDVRYFEADMVKKFTHLYGTLGLKTFLAMEEMGPDFGWSIAGAGLAFEQIDALAVAHQDHELIKKMQDIKKAVAFVYEKYVEANSATLKAESFLSENANVHDRDIAKEVIRRSRKEATLLFNELLSQPIDGTPESLARLQALASGTSSDSILLSQVFRALKQESIITNIESLYNTQREVIEGPAVLQDTELLQEVERIYNANYKAESEEFRTELVTRFKDKLAHGAKLHVLRNDELVLAFIMESEPAENTIELSALNINPALKITESGMLLLDGVMSKALADGKTIRADAPPDNARGYINTIGFVGTGVIEIAGVPLILVERNDTLHYASKERGHRGAGESHHVDSVRDIPSALDNGSKVITHMTIRRDEHGIDLTLEPRQEIPRE